MNNLSQRGKDMAKKQTPRVLPTGPKYGMPSNGPRNANEFDRMPIYKTTTTEVFVPLEMLSDTNHGTAAKLGKLVAKTDTKFVNARKPFPKSYRH